MGGTEFLVVLHRWKLANIAISANGHQLMYEIQNTETASGITESGAISTAKHISQEKPDYCSVY